MDQDKKQAFTAEELISYLSIPYKPYNERIIFTCDIRPQLKINKNVWQEYFAEFKGLEFKRNDEIEILPAPTGGSKIRVPEWIIECLAGVPGDAYCITQRDNRYYLKKFSCIEHPTELPSYYIIDSFEDLFKILLKKISRL